MGSAHSRTETPRCTETPRRTETPKRTETPSRRKSISKPTGNLDTSQCIQGHQSKNEREMVQITAITLTGKVVPVSVELSWTVDRLKTEIYNEEGIPTNVQRLILAGKHLEDGRALQEYNIREGSQVYIVRRMTGGGSEGTPPGSLGIN